MTEKVKITKVLPVLMAFFVMSFVDLVGIGVDRISLDLKLSPTLAQLIPSAAFLWFLLLSVPVGILQSRLGKRFMLNIGMLVTALGMLVPFFLYNFAMVLVGFALLGIGNTIVQVSANPLLVDVVPGNRSSSFLSFSQFVKAIGSMIAPPLAAMFAVRFGDWKILFLAFGIVSILTVLWLGLTPLNESRDAEIKASFRSAFKLLGNKFVLLMVLSIFVVVGIDVGFNSNSGQFLINSFGIEQTAAESGRSFYFFGRMVGTFGGALILTKISSRNFFVWTSVLGLVSLAVMLLFPYISDSWNIWLINALIVIVGLAVANIFPLVFSIAVDRFPQRSNEISGLMMMAISGGAIFPPIMGWITGISNNVFGMSVLLFCMLYLLIVAYWVRKR
ncbi:MAG: MFS transporter [Marinilabiliaceae bacterium]|jgi:fucose permease|nr:MFS transporter [Marinilabiliaceae bacterium]